MCLLIHFSVLNTIDLNPILKEFFFLCFRNSIKQRENTKSGQWIGWVGLCCIWVRKKSSCLFSICWHFSHCWIWAIEFTLNFWQSTQWMCCSFGLFSKSWRWIIKQGIFEDLFVQWSSFWRLGNRARHSHIFRAKI